PIPIVLGHRHAGLQVGRPHGERAGSLLAVDFDGRLDAVPVGPSHDPLDVAPGRVRHPGDHGVPFAGGTYRHWSDVRFAGSGQSVALAFVPGAGPSVPADVVRGRPVDGSDVPALAGDIQVQVVQGEMDRRGRIE